MTIISYAKNFEDVMLWRALKHVKQGFYMDVGAAQPDMDSVTRLFYDRGWRGINVEPDSALHAMLEKGRPKDINLCARVGSRDGAFMSQRDGQNNDRVTSLAEIGEKCTLPRQEIHFLKIDAEGHEEKVLNGNDWEKFRPWVVLIEGGVPALQDEAHDVWGSILLTAGYAFAYTDGPNRYYVAQEHAELMPAFKYPPNIFDEYVSSRQLEAEVRSFHAEARAEEAEARIEQLTAEARDYAAQRDAIYASTSWRITAPLRRIVSFFRTLLRSGTA